MPMLANKAAGDPAAWEPQAADGRLAHTAGADPSGVFSSDVSIRRLGAEHRLPETSPKPTFTLGLDQ